VEARPPVPPFDRGDAIKKVRAAEDAWNTRDPQRVALAYSEVSRWRNRSEFFAGRPAIEEFLTRKWARELDYRLIKEMWAFDSDRIAVRFAYEWHDGTGSWFRSYGNENWLFETTGSWSVGTRASTTWPSTRASGSSTGISTVRGRPIIQG
jgi:nuclear transport factor 2 (NTF2) superfamily protein